MSYITSTSTTIRGLGATIMAVAWCIVLGCTPACAAMTGGYTEIAVTGTIHAAGTSEIHLPAGVQKDGVDAIAVDQGGRNVPAEFAVRDGVLAITPCSDLQGGAICSVKVFAHSGKRFIIKAKVEEFPAFDPAHDSVVRVPAKPSKGFNYAYYLRIPSGIGERKDLRLLVHGNNDPNGTGVLQYTDWYARRDVQYGWGRPIVDALDVPYLIPVFPREGDDLRADFAYMQFMDRRSLLVKGQRERVDLQLAAMIRDARRMLEIKGIAVGEKVFMIGYSTDSKFAQRFTALHPEMVQAVAAGGVGGITILPLTEYKGEKLCYPIGVADLRELTGKEFDKQEYAKVPQFFFMGGDETTDATEYRDCFSQQEADQIWRLFGRKVMPDRWSAAQKVLADVAPNIQCKTYPGIGHTVTNDVRNDIAKFFQDHWTR